MGPDAHLVDGPTHLRERCRSASSRLGATVAAPERSDCLLMDVFQIATIASPLPHRSRPRRVRASRCDGDQEPGFIPAMRQPRIACPI